MSRTPVLVCGGRKAAGVPVMEIPTRPATQEGV